MYVVAIIAAGGQGRRVGESRPKQYLDVGGRSILERSVEALAAHPRVREVIVALPAASAAAPWPVLRAPGGTPVRIVTGGARRQDSVARAFEAVGPHADLILIHDAARPFVDAGTIDRTIDAAAAHGAAIAALPARDTVKVAEPVAGAGPARVSRTIPREEVWLAQTPQGFRRDVLAAAVALGTAGASGTDEAALAEQAGHDVRLVEGDPRNLKVTTAADLALVRGMVSGDGGSGETGATMRIGVGYDSHRFAEGRPLILGGVRVPYDRGLAGHSDADALCHAITDALLGAAALGDIGRHFPDSDPAWKDADSVALLRRATGLVREAGFDIANVDAVVIAERPKLAPHADAMRARLADAMGVAVGAVSVKGKTNEGLGDTGRGEGIVVHAVALLRRV
jgi:2-C-methyl-D-erythritol 4-phosphate cytidylyltransferase/2-C-methyl-D-erythritol 2,4-cyclodiphosphate synthase